MPYNQWKAAVLALIPGKMIYEIDLKAMFKSGMTPEGAVEKAQLESKIENRAPNSFVIEAQKNKRGRPQVVGVKRKPLWDLETAKCKVESALFAVCREAETHSLTPDAVLYIRGLQNGLAEEIAKRRLEDGKEHKGS